MNRFWKQNGEIATDKFKRFPKYHGLELLMEPNLSVASDLHRVAESAINIGPHLGNLCAKGEFHHPILEKSKRYACDPWAFLKSQAHRKGSVYGESTLPLWTTTEGVG